MTQVLEGVAFNENVYYNGLSFLTNHGKLKGAQSGLKWFTLTPQRPIAKIRIFQHPSTKRMNPHTYLGVMTYVPPSDHLEQYMPAADVTNVNHVWVDMSYRYHEWNENYNMQRQ